MYLIDDIIYKRISLEWFLDVVYLCFLIACFIALPYGVLLLFTKQDSAFYYILSGFIAYTAATYLFGRILSLYLYSRKK